MASRTFKLTSPAMHGSDVQVWQQTLNRQMRTWKIDYRIPEDGTYDAATRALTASVAHGLGLTAGEAMANGVTPELRVKLRKKNLSAEERARFDARADWRDRFRARHETKVVAPPLAVVLNDSWGYHPPVHDGVDLICNENAPLMAICDGEVIRADSGGWWGKGAPANAALKAKGDGIIVIRCSIRRGPFVPGLNFCYGHAEFAEVQVGDKVQAGDFIGRAGFANAWHTHFMVNGRDDAKGVGDRDPMLYLNFAEGR
jgi:murein DD-endopeptidase MepM/ murein hydrolase activator NlpD